MTRDTEIPLYHKKSNVKIKKLLLIFGIGSLVLSVLDYWYLVEEGSLLLSNITKNPTYYRWEDTGLIWLNRAIWLSDEKKYTETKNILLPLLNQAKPEHQAQISELYGDILYVTSGSLDDIIKVYERSNWFENEPRVIKKIDYFKNLKQNTSNSWSTANTGSLSTNSGSNETDIRKNELNTISKERSKYLNNWPTWEESMSELTRMMQSVESENVWVRQDW